MHILTLSQLIEDTFKRTVKFNPDGTVGHRLDRDVFKVISIAVAADILDRYSLSNVVLCEKRTGGEEGNVVEIT